ncbi:MAG: hypothetical protein D4R48_03465 [Nitrosomonadales bacterium]|nr:MAG: hypothetical protein D4R48_03465 [Nitrosomonadales bacterium]
MKKTFVIMLGCLLLSTNCIADTTVAVRTIEAKPCAIWTRDGEDKFSWPAIANRNWFVGFLSGIAVAANNDFLRGVDVVSLVAWMDNYCGENPLKFADEGAYVLARKLANKQPLDEKPADKNSVPPY